MSSWTTCQRCEKPFAADMDDQFLCDECNGTAELERFRKAAREYREAVRQRLASHERRIAQLEALFGMDRLPSSIDEAIIVTTRGPLPAGDNPLGGAGAVPVKGAEGLRGRVEVET